MRAVRARNLRAPARYGALHTMRQGMVLRTWKCRVHSLSAIDVCGEAGQRVLHAMPNQQGGVAHEHYVECRLDAARRLRVCESQDWQLCRILLL